jgi:hypothetical protein
MNAWQDMKQSSSLLEADYKKTNWKTMIGGRLKVEAVSNWIGVSVEPGGGSKPVAGAGLASAAPSLQHESGGGNTLHQPCLQKWLQAGWLEA